MQVESYHTIRPCCGEEVGHQFRGDRLATSRLLLLTCVSIVGNNGRDALSRGATKSINHHQQFHEMFVHGGTGRLHNIDISPSHAFLYLDMAFSIGEMIHVAFSQRASKLLSDESCQLWRGCATVDINIRNVFFFMQWLYCCCFCHDVPILSHTQCYDSASAAV